MNEPTKPPRIYTDPSQSQATVQIVGDMDLLEEKLVNMPDVQTEEEAEVVSEYRAQFRAKARDLDKERLQMSEGARQTVKLLNDKYNVIIERAKRCTMLADNKLMPYMRKKEDERLEAERQRRLQEDAERQAAADALAAKNEAERIARDTQDAEGLKKAEARVEAARASLDDLRKTPVAKPAAKSTTGVLGSSTRMMKVWKYKLTDITKVPEEFLVAPEERLNKGALNALAKSGQDTAWVPGITFYSEDTLSSRAGVRK